MRGSVRGTWRAGDDPERVSKLARIRYLAEHLRPSEVLLFIDELDIHLLRKDWLRMDAESNERLKS